MAAVVYGRADVNRYRASNCPNSPTSPAAAAVDTTADTCPTWCIAPYTHQATPPLSVAASTVERSCWSSTANVSDSIMAAPICHPGRSAETSVASGLRCAPRLTAR